ncbi:hypothetical protein G6F43_012584 [Rhizopus delemar]|nr:hypothetical protein G6F43_012584 [Rhizopus delemar]
MKKATFEAEARNSKENLQQRFDWFMQWKDSDLDYTRNCVFIDEAGFHINMRFNYGRSAAGTRARVKTEKLDHLHIQSLALFTQGTTTAHFIKFINELLDVMDLDESLKGCYLVLDNASIHKSQPMVRKIEKRGYKLMHLPPYSPELNLIEQFWALIKRKLKRGRMLAEENLSSKIADACNQVLISDLYGFASHSKRQIMDFYNKTPM